MTMSGVLPSCTCYRLAHWHLVAQHTYMAHGCPTSMALGCRWRWLYIIIGSQSTRFTHWLWYIIWMFTIYSTWIAYPVVTRYNVIWTYYSSMELIWLDCTYISSMSATLSTTFHYYLMMFSSSVHCCYWDLRLYAHKHDYSALLLLLHLWILVLLCWSCILHYYGRDVPCHTLIVIWSH